MPKIRSYSGVCMLAVSLQALWILPESRAATNTVDIMNAITACALGAKSTLTNETKGTIRRQIDGDIATGRAVDEILPKISDTILAEAVNNHNYELYDRYVSCLREFMKSGSSADSEKPIYVPERSRASYYLEANRLLGEKKYSEALAPLEQAAKLGEPEAEVALGVLYIAGLPGVPYRPDESVPAFGIGGESGKCSRFRTGWIVVL